MRNAIKVDQLIITIDNAGCIGEKPGDAVQASNQLTAYFTARTALLEQWCAGAKPLHILLANFTGDAAWDDYVAGIQQIFDEMNETLPQLTGSTESNFHALQSGLSLTMIGQPMFDINTEDCHYFVIGEPYVGGAVMANRDKIASLGEVSAALNANIIKAIWPTGSKGIGVEIDRFLGSGFTCDGLDLQCTAGPSTVILVAVANQHIDMFLSLMTAPVYPIYKIDERTT